MIKIEIETLGITTWAYGIDDVETAVREAVECFKIAAERFGLGVDEEVRLAVEDGQKEFSKKWGSRR